MSCWKDVQSILPIHPLPSLASANWRIFTPCEESDSHIVFISKALGSFPGHLGYLLFVDFLYIKIAHWRQKDQFGNLSTHSLTISTFNVIATSRKTSVQFISLTFWDFFFVDSTCTSKHMNRKKICFEIHLLIPLLYQFQCHCYTKGE